VQYELVDIESLLVLPLELVDIESLVVLTLELE